MLMIYNGFSCYIVIGRYYRSIKFPRDYFELKKKRTEWHGTYSKEFYENCDNLVNENWFFIKSGMMYRRIGRYHLPSDRLILFDGFQFPEHFQCKAEIVWFYAHISTSFCEFFIWGLTFVLHWDNNDVRWYFQNRTRYSRVS